MATTAITLVAIAWSMLRVAEDRPLAVAVESARIQFEPGFVRVRIRVAPHPDNRALAIGLVGDDFETSSLEELPGDRARVTRWWTVRDVPAGEYRALAEVVRADGSTRQAGDTLTIMRRGF